MPNRYVIDSHAWAEYLRGSPPGRRVKEIVEDGEVYTTSLTLAEVVSHVGREKQDSALAARAIQTISEILDVDSALAVAAAERQGRSDRRMTLGHAILIEASKKIGAEIVSGDKRLISARVISIL
jgi:predicted nucleic acid-binding protein